MFTTEDEKLDIATGSDDDRRNSVIETISRFDDKRKTRNRKKIKTNDTFTINNKTNYFITTKTSRKQ